MKVASSPRDGKAGTPRQHSQPEITNRLEAAKARYSDSSDLPAAIVLNMCYTGLGIARSLGKRGVNVIGLGSQRGVYGNFTRRARFHRCPDSKDEPTALLEYLLARSNAKHGGKPLLFPTRDHDIVFMNRFRAELDPHYELMIPSPPCLNTCLDKWETYQAALNADIKTPKCWKIDSAEDLEAVIREKPAFPCVLKPLSAHHWRAGTNGRKLDRAKPYAHRRLPSFVSNTKPLQRRIPEPWCRNLCRAAMIGSSLLRVIWTEPRTSSPDLRLKLVQMPQGFGTGCIVQTVDRPDLIQYAGKLLQAMRYTGIAEVEFKQDPRTSEYMLIEVNPRPWDQHRLGQASETDLVWHAYCETAGLAPPTRRPGKLRPCKWIADDVFVTALLRSLWTRDGNARALWRMSRGRRIYGIWQADDPMPSLASFAGIAISLARALAKLMSRPFQRTASTRTPQERRAT